jgi:type IV pilus assembly protein PilE
MIVVAVIAILASIALPSYQEQVRKGRRADARTQMAAGQQWMERFYSENFQYNADAAGTTSATLFANQAFSTSPRRGDGTAIYNVVLTATTSSYTITAAPFSTGTMATDVCGSLTLTFTGRKSSSSNPTDNRCK